MNRKRYFNQTGNSVYNNEFSHDFNEPIENPLISSFKRSAPLDTTEQAKAEFEGPSGKICKSAFHEEKFGAAISEPGYQNEIISTMHRSIVPENQDFQKTAKWKITFNNFVQLSSIYFHFRLGYKSIKDGLNINAGTHKILPSVGFLYQYIKSIRIYFKGNNNPINNNTRELYFSKFPKFQIHQPRKIYLHGDYYDFPFAENNGNRGKRPFIADDQNDDAWLIDNVHGREELETRLCDRNCNVYVGLKDLDDFGLCDTYFNNNHTFVIETDFNDDGREYLTASGKRTHWNTNVEGSERLVEIEHLQAPKSIFQDVGLSKEMSETLSDLNKLNPIQYGYAQKKV